MGGGLMSVVAQGAQDLFLTTEPVITFFKVEHMHYTNFAIESIENTFSGQVDFGKKVSCSVSRNGDLIWRTYVQVDLPAMTQGSGTVCWTRNIGHALLQQVEIQIGGQTIDTHYGDWLNIWNELTQASGKEAGYNTMIGNTTALTTPSASIPADTLYIPLQFWFCKNPGLALPLIALQYHEVKFNITFAPANQCYITDDNLPPTSGTPSLGNASLYIDYIYLDTDERKQFAQSTHEYLIEQLQYNSSESFTATSYKSKLSFNHPCKFISWVIQYDSNTASGANRHSDYTDSGVTLADAYIGSNPMVDAKLQLNGQDRFSVRKARYFNTVQPFQHFTRCPAEGVNTYSFSLNPENFQPSGTTNMSRIDTANLIITTTQAVAAQLRVYAVNVNILKFVAGMGGLSYSS